MSKMRLIGWMVVGIALSLIFAPHPANAERNTRETLKLLDLFGEVYEKVRDEYVEEPTDKKLIESAINGMLTSLDPHSSYLDDESFREMQIQTKGEFGGLGIEVTMRNGLVYIVSPIDDTPAYEAGLKAGDYITHIDGESVVGTTLREAVKKMRGKPKTKIILTVVREGVDQAFDVTIVRDIIRIRSVRSRVEGGDVIYLRITSFSEQTNTDLQKAIETQTDEIDGDPKGIVLDLRNNPGGLLNQAIAVSDMFLDRGEIVSTRGRKPEDTHRFNATSGDDAEGLPIVVLINGGSASASEIVAGALQDHGRGIVIGTKSFGKGSVQTVIPVQGDSAIRLTTSRYYTPSGRSIQAKGIDPDIIVEPATIEFVKSKSSSKNSEAALPGHLINGENDDDESSEEQQRDEEEASDADEKDEDDEASEENEKDADKKASEQESLYKRDYQLARAIDLLHALYIFKETGLVSALPLE